MEQQEEDVVLVEDEPATIVVDGTEMEEVLDEMTIEAAKKATLLKDKTRIEELYNVEIEFGIAAETNDGQEKQWLQLKGSSADRSAAKDHIKALCSPMEQIPLNYPAELHDYLSHPAVHGKLERKSGAAIVFIKPGEAHILGVDPLPVTLAMSAIEDLMTNHMAAAADQPQSPISGQASSRLDSELKRMRSQDDQIAYNEEELLSLPMAVKRTFLYVQESPVVNDTQKRRSRTQRGEGARPKTRLLNGPVAIPQDAGAEQNGAEAGAAASQSLPASLDVGSPRRQRLKKFALDEGYSDAEFYNVVSKCGSEWTASEFLQLLVDVRKAEGEQAAATSNTLALTPKRGKENKIQHPIEELLNSPNIRVRPSASTGEKNSLKPEKLYVEYLEQLSRDFTEESDNLSKEDLLKRNADRQRLLKEAFDKQKDEYRKAEENRVRLSSKSDIAAAEGGNENQGSVGQQGVRQAGDGNMEPQDGTDARAVNTNQNSIHGHHSQPYSQETKSKRQSRWDRGGPNSPSRNRHVQSSRRPESNSPQQHGGQSHKHPKPSTSSSHSNYQSFESHVASQIQPLVLPPSQAGGAQGRQSGASQQQQHQARPSTSRNTAAQFALPPPMPPSSKASKNKLKYIIIDGSNVAMAHGNQKYFSCRGIKLCIDYFLRRGHKEVTAFVPQWRTHTAYKPGYPISDQHVLEELRGQAYLVLTPARRVPGKNICCYDDKFVLRLAEETEGIIVSNDNYRDLWEEKREWRHIIEERLLMFSFVSDIFMPPDDPLGRNGPSLDQFLGKEEYTNNSWYPNALNQQRDPRQQYSNRPPGGNAQWNQNQRHYQGQSQGQGQYFDQQQAGPAQQWTPWQQQQHQQQQQQQQPPPSLLGSYPGTVAIWRQPPPPLRQINNLQQQSAPQQWAPHNPGQQQQQQQQQQHHHHGQQQQNQTNKRGQSREQIRNHPPPVGGNRQNERRSRSDSVTDYLQRQLLNVFPDNIDIITKVLINHPMESSLDKLSSFILESTST